MGFLARLNIWELDGGSAGTGSKKLETRAVDDEASGDQEGFQKVGVGRSGGAAAKERNVNALHVGLRVPARWREMGG